MPLTEGTKVGPYEVIAPAGAGGMDEVYRARDTRLNREIAIKVLPAGFARDPERLRRFQQEAQAAAALSHPNILTCTLNRHGRTSLVWAEAMRRLLLRWGQSARKWERGPSGPFRELPIDPVLARRKRFSGDE